MMLQGLSVWVEQWSKAGASPTFVVDNGEEYIKNFNWVFNWIEKYFFVKFIDQIAILGFGIVLIIILLKNSDISKEKIIFKNEFLAFFLIIVVIFYIWFKTTQHLDMEVIVHFIYLSLFLLRFYFIN